MAWRVALALSEWNWEGWDGCMHGIGFGFGQESKVKRAKCGRRSGFSMTFMRGGFFFFWRGCGYLLKTNLRIHMG
jgi:hypothetical protein